MILTSNYNEFIDYNVGPVFLMNLTGNKFSVKEIKELEDHKKFKSHLSFYVFKEIITRTCLNNYLRPIILQLKSNSIWFSSRPTGFTDSVGNYVAEIYSNNTGFDNYIYMTIQSRDYALRTKELILYHNINNNLKNKIKDIFDINNINYSWDESNDNVITFFL